MAIMLSHATEKSLLLVDEFVRRLKWTVLLCPTRFDCCHGHEGSSFVLVTEAASASVFPLPIQVASVYDSLCRGVCFKLFVVVVVIVVRASGRVLACIHRQGKGTSSVDGAALLLAAIQYILNKEEVGGTLAVPKVRPAHSK